MTESQQGTYFTTADSYEQVLPTWEDVEALLPQPIFDEKPEAIEAYWGAWQLAINSLERPQSDSGFVSNFLYMEFANAIFAHDTSLMLLFANYAFRAFKAIESNDNFYVKQHASGEICRQIDITTGKDVFPNEFGDPMRVIVGDLWETPETTPENVKQHWWHRPSIDTLPSSQCSVDALNDPPCFLLAELHYFQLSGDLDRLKRILPVQKKFYESLNIYLRDNDNTLITDWASMDNSPRNVHLGFGCEVTALQAYFADLLAETCSLCGDSDEQIFRDDANTLRDAVNKVFWNEDNQFYFDVDNDKKHIPIKSISGFFPLIAKACTNEQLSALIAQLNNPQTFNTPHRIPSLAADEELFTEYGNYYEGGVWSFTNNAVILGLERSGEQALAHEIAMNHWQHAVDIYSDTKTVWEYYAPMHSKPGAGTNPLDPGKTARKDFAGWGAFAPITYFLEHAIGLRPDAHERTLHWYVAEKSRCGCKNYAFADIVCDLSIDARVDANDKITLQCSTNKAFTLIIHYPNGEQETHQIKT